MISTEYTWDPQVPGQTVRLRDNPGRQGTTTGRTRKAGSYLLIQVDFGPNEKAFKPYDLLEPVEVEEDVLALLGAGRFGGPIDLRRVLTFEKVKGDLTNVFYSMEASNTDFYPHQFKAVLKFIESPIGRLLIADEVGLGKTIESIYIWKELQARQDARRLLVVCPAMLREKWRGDLRKRFNIAAEIVTSERLLDKVTDFVERRLNDTFVDIVSLESLRPPADFENDDKQSTSARFARLLDQNVVDDDFALFDLVIVDEAHYMRNPATNSNLLGRLLRESSHHMLLLTATPIQIGSNNLYELLRMIDPDEFYSPSLFGEMLRANEPIVRALRALWRQPPHVGAASKALDEALSNPYFANDAVLSRIGDQVDAVASDPARRVNLVRQLETRSLLSQYMTRSRKREVLGNRVKRSAQTLEVRFSDIEREIYERITDRIRDLSVGEGNASLFTLIARQRQMASSLVAALTSWQEKGVLEDLLWEDLGHSWSLGSHQIDDGDVNDMSPEDFLNNLDAEIDLEELERLDGKYNELRSFLNRELGTNPKEKFVVFAFFRGTLHYLNRRLRHDGIRTALIMGGMGDDKDAVLDNFRCEDGPPVLLSSEVGSEGIDLQFCRFVVNYDLPWNPMRVEQRIGRLDRLGQKAEHISIINLALLDTIEDRIVLRLYERIKLFEQSIGDLEDILGSMTERLMLELLNPELSDEDRNRRADETETAILNCCAEQDHLEQQAVNLTGFSDYILDHIRESRDEGHWLSADELIALVEDFFAGKYPGTKLQNHGKIESALRIRLSQEAQADLGQFTNRAKHATRTRLHQSDVPILCLFDPRTTEEFGRGVELIEPTHPLVRWIREDYEKNHRQLHPVSAVKLDAAKSPVGPGDYAFVTHRWSFAGLRSDHILMHSAMPLKNTTPLDTLTTERLIVAAERHGRTFVNAANVLGELQVIRSGAQKCDDMLGCAFEEHLKDFRAENEYRCKQQETSARKFSDRRIAELRGRIERFRAQGNSRLIPMTEGLLRKEERQLKDKLDRVAQRQTVDPSLLQLAAGVIRVE